MPKIKSQFICTECGYTSVKWLGKCPGCNSWNTLMETVISDKPASEGFTAKKTSAPIKKITEISGEEKERFSTGISELDRVLGGGIVGGSLVLVGGSPGIGKSTLLLQICENTGKDKRILYISGEESERQIKIRASRLGVRSENLYLVSETDVEVIVSCINSINPDIVIVDSIQTMHRDDIASSAGSVPQVREATNMFMHIAKQNNISMFIVGHVTKEGALAGPRVLEHMVDCVLYFEGDDRMSFRILRCVKNRFGSTNEIGVFHMTDKGLEEVENPSATLLEGRQKNSPGSAVVSTIEGSRGVLAEIQALVAPSGFGNPRRMANGIDYNRFAMLTAVLERRAGIKLFNSDIYVNVAGGLKLLEPAVDLGICIAIASAELDRPISADVVFIGEVGLNGELRTVSQLGKRLSEAAKMGFKTAVAPSRALKNITVPKQIKAVGITNLYEAIKILKAGE